MVVAALLTAPLPPAVVAAEWLAAELDLVAAAVAEGLVDWLALVAAAVQAVVAELLVAELGLVAAVAESADWVVDGLALVAADGQAAHPLASDVLAE